MIDGMCAVLPSKWIRAPEKTTVYIDESLLRLMGHAILVTGDADLLDAELDTPTVMPQRLLKRIG